jgi:RHS repeat-associated protein
MRAVSRRGPRWRTALLTLALLTTTLALEIAPGPLPAPLDDLLGPEPVQAGFCASNPEFTGKLTGSSSSTTALVRTTSPTVYGYISNVASGWSCTAYYRYSGITWNTSATIGTFRWGNLINSTGVSCNYPVGATDYVKGNSTTDCPDSDAEYALSASLPQGTYQADVGHDSTGDFSFVHTDCGSYYGGALNQTGETYSTGITTNRPGSNCDPIDTDGTATSQTVIYDATSPAVSITNPGSGGPYKRNYATYQPVWNATDNVAGFGGAYLWSLQRQTAPISGSSCGTTWTNDGSPVTGTAQTTQTGSAVSLTDLTCYRWTLSAEDRNGNGPVSVASGAMYIDRVVPTVSFAAPAPSATIPTVNTTAFSVVWADSDAHSGVGTRSLQRQRVASASSACTGTFTNDGSALTSASPSAQTLTTGYCYQWVQTVTDVAQNQTVSTSSRIYVDTTSPSTNFSTPDEGTTTVQSSTSYSVAWSESAPAGFTIASRSLQRERGTVVTPNTCAGVTWASDGSAVTTTSPVSATGLSSGYCYRWKQTLTNSAAKTSVTVSGMVLIDTTAPTATITAPAANAPGGGDLVITGSASDAGSFKEYQLEYGAGASPSSWTSLGTFTSPVTAGTLHTWSTAGLSGVVTIRLTARENASATTTTATRTLILENAGRGTGSFLTRVPFELGGGWGLDVGVHNGEARLSRDLLDIPSYGPSQALSLSYSSLETSATGRFGVGWQSNLTQYLTFDATDIVVWHRADGGRVPFGKVGGAWTALAGQYETLSLSGGEYSVTTTDQTEYVFESSGAGRLKRIENRFGKALTLAWSTSSATATDASGRVMTLAIDPANDRVTGVTDSAGRAWAFGYTGTGAASQLTSVTDPAAKVTTLAYTSGLLTSVTRSRTRAAGGSDTITWAVAYTSGRVASVTDPIDLGAVTPRRHLFAYNGATTTADLLQAYDGTTRSTTTYEIDHLGRVESLIDPLGLPSTFVYTGWTQLDTYTPAADGESARTIYTFDARGNVLSETTPIDATTTVVTLSTYSASNDLLTRTEADNDSATRMVTKYTYDGSGHLTSVNVNCTTSGTTPPASGAGGTCTGAGTQDAATNLITNYAYTANDQLSHEQDPLGRVTRYTYDSHGNQTGMTRNCTTSGTSAPSPFSSCTGAGTADAQTNVTSSSTYDQATTAGKAGYATKTTDALGRDTTSTYDALGRQLTEVLPGDASIPVLTRTTTYDEFGGVLTAAESWTPLGGGSAITRTTTSAYDLVGREITSSDPLGLDTTTAYDAQGNAVENVAPTGVTTTRLFDRRNQQLREAIAVGSATGPGFVESILDHRGNVRARSDSSAVETGYEVTYTGLVEKETTSSLAGAPFTQRTHDRLGRELTVTTPELVVTTSTYDRLGRQLTTTTDGATTTYAYDRAGNQVSVTDPAGIVTTTVYDPLDRAVATIANDVASPSGPTQDVTTTTSYDKVGTAIAVKDPKGITTRTITNVRDMATDVIANCTDSGTTPTANPASCTGAGTANATTNVHSTVTYDGTGATVGTTSAVGTGAAATTEVAYDAAGRTVAVKDPRGTITRSFYDPATGELVKTVVNCTTSGTTIPTDWIGCTGAGTQDGTFNLTTTYTYDDHGNQSRISAPNGRVTEVRYDEAERIIERVERYVDGIPSAGDDFITTTFYDLAGRAVGTLTPTASGTTRIATRFVYDDDGRLLQEIRNCTDSGTSVPADAGACAGTGTLDAATNISTSSQYDDRGNRIRMTAPDPSAAAGGTATVTTQYAYDDADRLCRVVENATGSTNLQTLADPCLTATQTAGTTTTNVSTRYTYDGAGNLATMVDARGNTTTYGYDAAGRMTGLTDALGETLVWVYDALGNKLRQENRADPIGTYSVQYTYDGAGRVLTRQADGVTVTSTYDANGNRLTIGDGTFTITTTYDRLNRPLTVDDEDAGTTADTTYTYALTSPSWTDPSGSYGATLDAFDRPTAVNDPVNASDFTWTYRADGQPLMAGAPNGNWTEHTYDALGRLTGKDTDTSNTTGGTDRAVYAWTHNRAGQILSEASTITGDASNGTVTYTYDPLERLTGSTLSGTTTGYGWDTVPNRTSVQVGAGTPATTTYDAANRPSGGANPSAAYSSDDDGRLTAAPGFQYSWDDLGRLTQVRNGGGTVLATYTYDPLDRLRMADYGGGSRVRFRYTGLTTSAAQWLDDAAGTVTRSIANGWLGERLADWTGGGSNLRIYGTNGHRDVTWLASSSGTVSQALRYDPWGNPRAAVPSGYTPFRFQGAWFDATTSLNWVVTRWYAPSLGRFISEDTLLGDPTDPPSRHLYAYAAGEPIGRWDPDGRWWYKVRFGDGTTKDLAAKYLGSRKNWARIYNANRLRIASNQALSAGWCVWIQTWEGVRHGDQCVGLTRTGGTDALIIQAANKLGLSWANLTQTALIAATEKVTGYKNDVGFLAWPSTLAARIGRYASWAVVAEALKFSYGSSSVATRNGLQIVSGSGVPRAVSPTANAFTVGNTVFVRPGYSMPRSVEAHEYIHTLEYLGSSQIGLVSSYLMEELWSGEFGSGSVSNRLEAIGYLWEGWIRAYDYAGIVSRPKRPWEIWKLP